MGIAYPVPVSVVEFSTMLSQGKTIDTGGYAGDIGAEIDIPSWLANQIDRAYVDWCIPYVMNTAGFDNFFNASNGVKVSPGATGLYYNAIDIISGTLLIPANATFTGFVRIVGDIDIKTYVEQSIGSHIHVYLDTTTTQHDSFKLYLDYATIRIYIKG